jgi:hypothetical protein
MEVAENFKVQKSNLLIGLKEKIPLNRRPPNIESNLGTCES